MSIKHNLFACLGRKGIIATTTGMIAVGGAGLAIEKITKPDNKKHTEEAVVSINEGGKNDYEAMRKAGDGGHKEINRTNYTFDECIRALNSDMAKKQLELLKLRYSHPAFNVNSVISVEAKDHILMIKWQYDMHEISLFANLDNYEYSIR